MTTTFVISTIYAYQLIADLVLGQFLTWRISGSVFLLLRRTACTNALATFGMFSPPLVLVVTIATFMSMTQIFISPFSLMFQTYLLRLHALLLVSPQGGNWYWVCIESSFVSLTQSFAVPSTDLSEFPPSFWDLYIDGLNDTVSHSSLLLDLFELPADGIAPLVEGICSKTVCVVSNDSLFLLTFLERLLGVSRLFK